MNDEVSAEDRALIDTAVAEGRVRKIPFGLRAITLADFTYDARSSKLKYADSGEGKQRLARAMRWGRGKAKERGEEK